MDWKLELVAIPVSDVDRAKAFYTEKVGFNADHDHRVSDEIRFVQLTPPGSACSIALGTGIMDLMQVHNLVDVETQLATLREWKAAGRIRYLGITHYNTGGHAAVARLMETQVLDFVQINYSAGEREAEKRILPLARDRGIAVLANRPFAGGDLARANLREVPAWAAEIECVSWPQILLKFVISHPAVTCAIPATSNLAHLRANMAAGLGPLPDAALRERIAQSF